MDRKGALQRYVAAGHHSIDGWLDQSSAAIIATLALRQTRWGHGGAIGEIGVHHGRLFILLALAAAPGETRFAIDVFEQQELNTDGSGLGNREAFYGNLRANGLDPDAIEIITASSLDITGEQLRAQVGPVRLLSIDGGHTEECVVNDLRIADDALADHGVAIVDDVFNSTWPAVVSGYARYLLDKPATVPFASAPNKVFACRPQFVDHYRGIFRRNFPRLFDRSDSFFGFPIDGYGMWAQLAAAAARQRAARGRPVGLPA